MRFFAGHFGRKKRTETHKKKSAKTRKMHKNAPFCTDACNTPVYYTPVSVHPTWIVCVCMKFLAKSKEVRKILSAETMLPFSCCPSVFLCFFLGKGGGGQQALSAKNLDGQNRQSPIASVQGTQSTLADHSAVPRGMNTAPTDANRAIRIAMQRTQGL